MLLVEMTINSVLHRLSFGGRSLDHYWHAHIIGFGSPQYKLENQFGGYVSLSLGQISLSPELFTADWPPPTECAMTIKWTADTEVNAIKFFDASAYIARMTRDSVTYDLHGAAYDDTIEAAEVLGDTLAGLMSDYAATMGLGFDSYRARSPSPDVIFTTTEKRRLVDHMSDLCAFFSHLFYIHDDTLYLVDMLTDNGTRALGIDFFPPRYEWEMPVSIINCGDFVAASNYPYGDEKDLTPFHDTQANVEAALLDVISLVNKPRCAVPVPIAGLMPVPGEKISWTDDALGNSTDVWIRTRTIQYDFDGNQAVLYGEGELNAT